jgi:OOP family OmpA-OmpF porin
MLPKSSRLSTAAFPTTQLPVADRRCAVSLHLSGLALAATLALAALLAIASCATTGGLTRRDVLAHYKTIDQLSSGVAAAAGRDAALLAPQSFKQATAQLDKAIEHAQEAEKAEANQAAQAGLSAMQRVNANLAQSRDVFSEVLETRERARSAGAPDLFAERYHEADDALRKQAKRVESGSVAGARDSLPSLVKTYAQLELDALKKGTLEAAKQAVKHAEDNAADDYAPRTLKQAKQELKLLISLIEADRTQTDKADKHAKRTIWLAQRADEITALGKRFDEQDLDHEGIILWYQQQLSRIRQPLTNDVPFDKPNAVVVDLLRSDLQGLLSSLEQMREGQKQAQHRIADLQQKIEQQRVQHEMRLKQALAGLRSGKEAHIASLQRELSRQASAEAEATRRRKMAEQRFRDVQALFSADQGEVLRKGDNVILRLHGFSFPSGKSTIEAKNFGLLNQIVTAINTFPDSKIEVSGHTDASGSDAVNLKLSIERANNVEAFLTTTGGVSAQRVTSEGRGEAEPVASNETREGRAQNRRIEVMLVNEAVVASSEH